MSRTAMQMALEALERLYNDTEIMVTWDQHRAMKGAITALKQALAEPEQEPVAVKQMLRWVEHLKRLSDDGQHMSIPGLSSGACWELAIELEQFIRTTAPTPQPKQEPVGWQWLDTANYRKKLPANAIREHWRPLYTAPTPRKPLTDEEIERLEALCIDPVDANGWGFLNRIRFARAIERAHGIGEQT